jgi:hypothetical protein
MRIIKALSPILAGFVGIAVISPAASVEAAPTVQAVSYDLVKGRVVTTGGEPLSDALVSVIISGGTETVITARTQSDGSYKLSVPNIPGVYTLRVLHMGYSPMSMTLTRGSKGWNVPEEVTMRPIANTELTAPSSENDAE